MSTTDDLETGNAQQGERWSFDDAVTDAFEDMLARSIPQYEVMRKFVTDSAGWLVDRAGFSGSKTPAIVDLGASRGEALAPLVDKFGARSRYLACDVSEPMLDACRQRFSGMIDAGVVEVRHHDLREGVPVFAWRPHAVLSVLTLQFVPIEYRQMILRGIYDALGPGGGLIMVEKVLGGGFEMDKLLVDLYWNMKRENGYAQEAIDRKRLALEGVLVPVTARFNEEMLRDAGFDMVECGWRYMNFCGWIAIRR